MENRQRELLSDIKQSLLDLLGKVEMLESEMAEPVADGDAVKDLAVDAAVAPEVIAAPVQEPEVQYLPDAEFGNSFDIDLDIDIPVSPVVSEEPAADTEVESAVSESVEETDSAPEEAPVEESVEEPVPESVAERTIEETVPVQMEEEQEEISDTEPVAEPTIIIDESQIAEAHIVGDPEADMPLVLDDMSAFDEPESPFRGAVEAVAPVVEDKPATEVEAEAAKEPVKMEKIESVNDVEKGRLKKVVNEALSVDRAWRKDKPGPKVNNILSAISLNDRMNYIRVLFNDNPVLFQQTVSSFNKFTSLDEAEEMIAESFPSWDMDSKIVYGFMMAVRRRLG